MSRGLGDVYKRQHLGSYGEYDHINIAASFSIFSQQAKNNATFISIVKSINLPQLEEQFDYHYFPTIFPQPGEQLRYPYKVHKNASYNVN